jgi:hypothetical protein
LPHAVILERLAFGKTDFDSRSWNQDVLTNFRQVFRVELND